MTFINSTLTIYELLHFVQVRIFLLILAKYLALAKIRYQFLAVIITFRGYMICRLLK
jgi:hypothetical protein